MKVVIIGGGTAGTSAALELRKRDKDVEITILERSQYPLYSPCSLPYVIEGKFDFGDVFVYKKEDYEKNDIDLKLGFEVSEIDFENKVVKGSEDVSYDKLILAFGQKPVVPSNDLKDYYVFKDMEDAKKVESEVGGKVSIVGGGFVGVELAWALSEKGCDVKLIENEDRILKSVFSKKVREYVKKYLESNGVEVKEGSDFRESVGEEKVIFCCGFETDLSLVRDKLDCDKGVRVNERLECSEKDVYACGDCIELEDKTNLALPAVKEASIVVSNVLGGEEKYYCGVSNFVSKVGEVYFGGVGLNSEGAKEKGFDCVEMSYKGESRESFVPDKKDVLVNLVADKRGELLGGEIVSEENISGSLDLLSLGLQKGITLDELSEMNNCYNPMVSNLFDPIVMAAKMCKRKLEVINEK